MKYLIIGANAAGMSAAVRISKFDKTAKITVLEKSDVVSFGACGIPYYLAGEFQDIGSMTARPLQDFIESGIDIRLYHKAVRLDAAKKTIFAEDIKNNKSVEFSYDKLLISTGASPVQLPIKGVDLDNVHTMHSRADAVLLKEKLKKAVKTVIVGAGYIGVEAAESFKHLGKEVTLIEYAPRILARSFDTQITEILEKNLIKKGINLRLHEGVSEIQEKSGGTVSVVTGSGAYDADLVIMATGFRPNTEFLAGCGLEFSAQGAIVVDDQGRTALPDVFSAGDCATVRHRIAGNSYIPLATSANKLGRITGEVMAGKDSRFTGTLGSAGIRVFDMEAGRTGIGEDEARSLGLDYAVAFIKDKNRTDYVLPQTDMWVKLIYEKNTRCLLGGQICGSYLGGAVHRVDALAVAIYSQLTVEELGFMDLIYAPPFARTWDILNIAGNVAK